MRELARNLHLDWQALAAERFREWPTTASKESQKGGLRDF